MGPEKLLVENWQDQVLLANIHFAKGETDIAGEIYCQSWRQTKSWITPEAVKNEEQLQVINCFFISLENYFEFLLSENKQIDAIKHAIEGLEPIGRIIEQTFEPHFHSLLIQKYTSFFLSLLPVMDGIHPRFLERILNQSDWSKSGLSRQLVNRD